PNVNPASCAIRDPGEPAEQRSGSLEVCRQLNDKSAWWELCVATHTEAQKGVFWESSKFKVQSKFDDRFPFSGLGRGDPARRPCARDF
ncbi:MAG TPA: hypothetical protein VEL06_15940, partial [Haliangiales bacterium]|nr:hypothetical protein [Haliangiales bacterium]